MMTTKIEWADETWNPITGCTHISEGCDHCYARRMAIRLAGRYGYPEDDPFDPGICHQNQLERPLSWRRPRMVFVCSMGDLFHEKVGIINGCRVLGVAESAPQHIYLFLTKRPELMKGVMDFFFGNRTIPKNWWLGVTAENQQRANERIPILLQIPAAVRFVSVEPMLSPVDMRIIPCRECNHSGNILQWPCPHCKGRRFEWPDWVICGAETGPNKRRMDLDWAKSLRDQCVSAGVPFFFKKDSDGNHTLDGKVWEQFPCE